MHKKYPAVWAIILASACSIVSQSTTNRPTSIYPADEEPAANKRLRELLKHPTFITLRLLSQPRYVPREQPTDTPAPYKIKDWIRFQLFITQNSSQDVILANYLNPYYEYRPELMRDGYILPYTKKAEEQVERFQRKAPEGSMKQVTLSPGQEYAWLDIDLENWYEPLISGRYQLIIRKQFAWDGYWVTSNPVYFEVQPRSPGAPIPAGVAVEIVPDGLKPYQLGSEDYVRA
jgi:hypothetical protein